MRYVLLTLVLLGGLFGFLLLTNPHQPAAYLPPPAPELVGVLAPNNLLQQAEILGAGEAKAPEDVDQDAEGWVYGGLEDGRIIRLNNDQVETFADTGGRPLGLHFDMAGDLVVADAMQGLLLIEPDGKITQLVTEVDGVALGFTDDVDIAADGSIYFSDASTKWAFPDYKSDLLETRPYGRLIRYEPASGEVETLLKDLYFANGVAVSEDEDYVLVNESWTYRVLRYWLTGPRAGQMDAFSDNLPGIPDGISRGRHPVTGEPLYWVALATPRNNLVDRIHPYPWLKKLIMSLPAALQPKPVHYGLVLALNAEGEIIKSLHDPEGETLYQVTSVQQVGDNLYFGSLQNDRIGRLSVRALFTQ